MFIKYATDICQNISLFNSSKANFDNDSENNNPITFENYLYSHFYCLSPDNGTLNGFNALEDNLKF